MEHHFPQSITMEALLLEKRLNIRQKNFYCVFRGREIGIFTTWSACEQRVDGFSHASFKGYSTLPAAIEAMRQAGISEPILFHRNMDSPQAMLIPMYIITKGSSQMKSIEFKSDDQSTTPKSLSIDLDTSLDEMCIEAKALITSPNMSDSSSDIISDPNTSTSETEIIFSSSPKPRNVTTESKDSLSTLTFGNEDRVDVNTMSQKPSQTNPSNHALNIDIISLINQVSRKQDEMLLIQKQELGQIKEQNNRLQSEIQILKEQNTSITSKLDQAQSYMLEEHSCWEKARINIVDSSNQITMAQSTIQQFDQQMKHFNEITDELSYLKEEIDLLKKENHQIKKDNENLLSQLDSSGNKTQTPTTVTHNVTQNRQTTQLESTFAPPRSKETEPCTDIESDRFSLKPTTSVIPQASAQLSENLVPRKQGNSEHFNHTKSSKSDTSINDSDSEFDLPSIVSHQLQNKKENNNIKQNYLKVSPTCKNLLLGDSNMKNIQRKRLDKSGQTEIRTYRGASIKTLDKIIQNCSHEYTQVQKVSICIGTIDCTRNPINCDQIMDDYEKLITTTKKVFPSALICILSIPPQSIPKANKFINVVNNHLSKLAQRHSILHSRCLSLWNHVEPNGRIDHGLLYDRVHLSERGLSYLLKNVSGFFFRHNNLITPSQQNGLDLFDMYSYPALGTRDATWSQEDPNIAKHSTSSATANWGRQSPPHTDTYAMKLKASTCKARDPPPYSTIAARLNAAAFFPGFETLV